MFTREGATLFLVARNTDRLQAIGAELGAVLCITKDLAQPGAAEDIGSRLQKEGIVVDILEQCGHRSP